MTSQRGTATGKAPARGARKLTRKPGERRPLTRRILAVWDLAIESQLRDGILWYVRAHALAVKLDHANPNRAAGVLAALSPRCEWGRNVKVAIDAYNRYNEDPTAETFARGVLGNNCRKADEILRGADPLTALKANKVHNFYVLIADPTNPHAVCVDRHAMSIAVGKRLTDHEIDTIYKLGRGGRYEAYVRAFRRAADEINQRAKVHRYARADQAWLPATITPAMVQAVTWLVWRDLAK